MSTEAAHIVTLQPGQTIMSADAIAHERSIAIMETALAQITWHHAEVVLADPTLHTTASLLRQIEIWRELLVTDTGHLSPVAVADTERAIGRATVEILARGELTFA